MENESNASMNAQFPLSLALMIMAGVPGVRFLRLIVPEFVLDLSLFVGSLQGIHPLRHENSLLFEQSFPREIR